MGRKILRRRRRKLDSDPTQEYLIAFDAKQRFLASVLNMGWRLAVTFLAPVIIGAWLDNRYDTTPSWTLTALFVAVAASVVVIKNTVKEVDTETNRMNRRIRRGRKNVS